MQTCNLMPWIKAKFFDDNNNPLNGGKVYTYQANSQTPAVTYTDYTCMTENANPIILDARGEANIWLDGDIVYKIVVKDSFDVTIDTIDGVKASLGGGGGSGLEFVTSSDTDSVDLEGLGTPANPLTANVRISDLSLNAISITSYGITSMSTGLYAKDLGPQVVSLETAVSDLETQVTTNTANIATNTSDIATNTSDITDLQADVSNLDTLKYGASSGLYQDGTGILSVGSGGAGVATTFSITDGSGFIENLGVVSTVTWSGKTDIPVTNIATQNITFVSIDVNGNVIQQGTRWTASEKRQNIILGVVVHVNRVTVDAVNQEQAVINNSSAQVGDVLEGLGFLNLSGNKFGPYSTNLQLAKTSGVIMNRGINFYIDGHENPHKLTLPVLNPVTALQYRMKDGTSGPLTATVVNPNIWDDGSPFGSAPSVPTNKFTVQRIYSFTSNNVKIQPGQAVYNSLAEAKGSIQTESFATEPSIEANGILRGYLCIQQGTTNLADTSKVFFLDPGKYGGGIGVGGLSVSTMQNTYDNSTSPEIVTDSTRGALTLKRGSASDTDSIFEGQNGAGTITSSIKGNGEATFSGGADIRQGASGLNIKMPSGAYIGTGANPTLGANIYITDTEYRLRFGAEDRFRAYAGNTYLSGGSGLGDITLGTNNDYNSPNYHLWDGGIVGSTSKYQFGGGVAEFGSNVIINSGSFVRPSSANGSLYFLTNTSPGSSLANLWLENNEVRLGNPAVNNYLFLDQNQVTIKGKGDASTILLQKLNNSDVVKSSLTLSPSSANIGTPAKNLNITDTTYTFSAVPSGTPTKYYGEDASGDFVSFTPPTIPTNYVTTNTTQTGLSGNKSWTGVHNFGSRVNVNGASDNSSYGLNVSGSSNIIGNIDVGGSNSSTLWDSTFNVSAINRAAYTGSSVNNHADMLAGVYFNNGWKALKAGYNSQLNIGASGSLTFLNYYSTVDNEPISFVARFSVDNTGLGTFRSRLNVNNASDNASYAMNVNGSINLSSGSNFYINGTPISSGTQSTTLQFGRWFNSYLSSGTEFPPSINWGDDGTLAPGIQLRVLESKTIKAVSFEAISNVSTFDLVLVKNGTPTTVGSVTSTSHSFTGLSISVSAGDKIVFRADSVTNNNTLKGVCIVARME